MITSNMSIAATAAHDQAYEKVVCKLNTLKSNFDDLAQRLRKEKNLRQKYCYDLQRLMMSGARLRVENRDILRRSRWRQNTMRQNRRMRSRL